MSSPPYCCLTNSAFHDCRVAGFMPLKYIELQRQINLLVEQSIRQPFPPGPHFTVVPNGSSPAF
jgi:hypothetical protein